MRVTQRMMTDNAIKYMDENLQRLQALNEKVATGKKFQRASEDPAAASSALSLRSHLEASQAYLDTAHVADDWMTATDYSIRQMTEAATRAITLTQSGVSDTMGANERRALGDEMNILLQQAVGLGNTEHLGSYIFAGFRTTTRPFQLLDSNGDGLYDGVGYNGDAGSILRSVGPGQTITQNIHGDTAFSPLFTALIGARDALYANDGAAAAAALGGLQGALDDLTEAMTTNGARQRQVRAITDRIEKTQIEVKSLLSLKEDVNMAEAISNFRYQETVYQSVLEVSNRAISAMNLFDILG